MSTKQMTTGEAYADSSTGLRDRLDKMQAATQPIHEAVACLMAEGLTGEQAWAEVLKRVRPA